MIILVYRKTISSIDPVQATYTCGDIHLEVLLEVGQTYRIVYSKPTKKKDRANNGKEIEVLGFTDDFMGDAIVRYLDNNRRGRSWY